MEQSGAPPRHPVKHVHTLPKPHVPCPLQLLAHADPTGVASSRNTRTGTSSARCGTRRAATVAAAADDARPPTGVCRCWCWWCWCCWCWCRLSMSMSEVIRLVEACLHPVRFWTVAMMDLGGSPLKNDSAHRLTFPQKQTEHKQEEAEATVDGGHGASPPPTSPS